MSTRYTYCPICEEDETIEAEITVTGRYEPDTNAGPEIDVTITQFCRCPLTAKDRDDIEERVIEAEVNNPWEPDY